MTEPIPSTRLIDAAHQAGLLDLAQATALRAGTGITANSDPNRVVDPTLTLVQVLVGNGTMSWPQAKRLVAQLIRQPPSQVGPWRLGRVLGRGGVGVVHWAEGPAGIAAVKLIPASDDQMAARFERETAAVRALSHPKVVRCLDAGQTDGWLWLAMEFADQGDAGQMVAAHGPLPDRQALGIIRDAAAGLSAIHAAGLLHRDLKPSNVLISTIAEADGRTRARALVGDLGLARLVQGDGRVTLTGQILGTPAYLAPEVLADAAAASVASDLFGLGATLYTLVTGRPPYTGASPWVVAGLAMHDPFPDPREDRPGIDDRVRQIILAACARDPASRYAQADHLREDCANVLAGLDPEYAVALRRPWLAPRPVEAAQKRLFQRLVPYGPPAATAPHPTAAEGLSTVPQPHPQFVRASYGLGWELTAGAVAGFLLGAGLVLAAQEPARQARQAADVLRQAAAVDPIADPRPWQDYLARWPEGPAAGEAQIALRLIKELATGPAASRR